MLSEISLRSKLFFPSFQTWRKMASIMYTWLHKAVTLPYMNFYSDNSSPWIISASLNHCCLPVQIWHNQQVAQLYFTNFILTTNSTDTSIQQHWNSTAGHDLKEFPLTSKSLEVCILRLAFIPNIIRFWGYCVRTSHFISADTINQVLSARALPGVCSVTLFVWTMSGTGSSESDWRSFSPKLILHSPPRLL